ncbi:MAG: hypothetical protein P1U67_02130 [Alcanivoracaceae bacterium]|nr:hypothetical protein [Alcanivoracaceae bacterium]
MAAKVVRRGERIGRQRGTGVGVAVVGEVFSGVDFPGHRLARVAWLVTTENRSI